MTRTFLNRAWFWIQGSCFVAIMAAICVVAMASSLLYDLLRGEPWILQTERGYSEISRQGIRRWKE